MLFEPEARGNSKGRNSPDPTVSGSLTIACTVFAAVRPVKADIRPGALRPLRVRVDRVVARPPVVGLPGIVGALHQHIGRAVVADDEDDVALPVGFGRRSTRVVSLPR